MGKLPVMKHLLAWAERHGTVPISESEAEALRCHLDECPVVISHLLWAFLNVNLTAAAREIFCNVADSHGFEVWRRINLLIFSRSEQRQDEVYSKIHAPRVATSLADVLGAFEEWDTN